MGGAKHVKESFLEVNVADNCVERGEKLWLKYAFMDVGGRVP